MAYKADALAAWIVANVPPDDMNEKAIASNTVNSLIQTANQLRSFMTSGNINNEGVANKLEELAQGATMAMNMISPPPMEGAMTTPSEAPSAAPSVGSPTGLPGTTSPFQEGQADTGIRLTFDKARDTSTLISNPQIFNYIKNLISDVEATTAKSNVAV